MGNDEPGAELCPRRPALRSATKLRDIAAINRELREAELEEQTRRIHGHHHRLDDLLGLPPGLCLVNYASYLFPRWRAEHGLPDADLTFVSLALWGVAVLVWTPWLIFRVDNRTPPGDTPRATAILGYGLLAWPLAVGPMFLAPQDHAIAVGFAFIFMGNASAMLLAARPSPAPRPSSGRALMLAGGGGIYLAITILLVAVIVRWSSNLIEMWGGVAILAILGVATGWAAFGVLRAAARAWRDRRAEVS